MYPLVVWELSAVCNFKSTGCEGYRWSLLAECSKATCANASMIATSNQRQCPPADFQQLFGTVAPTPCSVHTCSASVYSQNTTFVVDNLGKAPFQCLGRSAANTIEPRLDTVHFWTHQGA